MTKINDNARDHARDTDTGRGDARLQLDLLTPDTTTEIEIPLAGERVSAGFPSPAEDFMEPSLDLNRTLVRNAASTFFARVSGESMKDAGIGDGDLLVVDKSIAPYDGCIAVCFLDGEFTLKRVRCDGRRVTLLPANPRYRPIEVGPDDEFSVWGVVTYSIRKH